MRQTEMIRKLPFAAVASALLLLATPAFPQVTKRSILDSGGDVGQHTSIATGADGLGLISYYDATNGDLKVAHCSDVLCSAATISTIDSVGNVGQYTSIAIGADGLGLISYYDVTNKDLKVAHCSNQLCSAASLRTLDSEGDVGTGTSLAIGSDGLGLVAYSAYPSMKVAHCLDVPCLTAELSILPVASVSSPGISMAIGSDGLGLISAGLRIVHCSNLSCNSATATPLTELGGVWGSSVVTGPGLLPRIVWSSLFIPELYVYQCADAACATASLGPDLYTLELRPMSLTPRLGTDGKMLVAFEHSGLTYNPLTLYPSELRVIHCQNDACSAGPISVIDQPTPTIRGPLYPGLTMGSDGFGLISYYDGRNGNLMVAHCGNTACTSSALSVGNATVTVAQGQAGAQTMTFPVTLSPSSPVPVTVEYATQNGTATAPTDYATKTGTLTFTPGETTRNIEVLIPASSVPRPDITFTVTLSNPTEALVSQGVGTGTIRTEIPAFSIGPASVQRGASGTSLLRFPVSLLPAVTQTATVRASTVAGGTATVGVDYTSTTTVLSFAPGETEKYFEVPVIGQPWGEPDESVNAKLTEATGAPLLDDTGVGTITSSVVPIPTISVQDVSVLEGNAGLSPVVFTFTLSPPSGEPVTFAFETQDGAATAGTDYEATSGTVTFPPGALTRTVRVMVKGNTTIGNDRSFSLALGPNQIPNAVLSRSDVTGTILDDDLAISFTADPVFVTAGTASTLQWSAPAGATLQLDGQSVTGPSGSQQVTPAVTRTYTLQAVLAGAIALREVTVNVVPASGVSVPTITAPGNGTIAFVSGVSLSWNPVMGACGYDLRFFDRGNGRTVFAGSLSGGSSTSTLVSMSDGVYLFAVRACLTPPPANPTYGGWASSNFSVQRLAPTGRPTVTLPAASASLTQSTQTLSWTPVTGNPFLPDPFYEVLVEDIAAGATSLQIAVPHPTTSTIFTFPSSTEYRLRVRACQAGCGAWSDPVAFSMTLPSVPTATPTAINCSVAGGNSLTCGWGAVGGADAYRIQVVQPAPAGPGGGALTVAARQVSTTQVTLPVPSGNAAVFVAACNGDGCGPYAQAPANINPAGPNPTTPNLGTPMAGTVVDGPGVFFGWNRVPGDDGTNTWYRLFVQDLSRQATALDVLTKNNFYSAYFKAEGARYDARVVANPGAGEVSGPAQGFNVAGASGTSPTMVAPTHNGSFPAGNLQLGWTPIPGATLYEYYVSLTGPSNSATASGVTPGLFVQAPLRASDLGQPLMCVGIVRACPAGAVCLFGSDAGWGPWSNAPGGSGVTNFTVVP